MENRNRHRRCSPADKPNRIIQIIRRINYGIIAENPAISLANARSLAHDNRTAVAEGRDPVLEKRMAREASRSPTPSIPTFAEAASHVIELRRPTWSNTKLAAQWRNTLATYANPLIGSKPVDEVNSGDVLAVLIPILNKEWRKRVGGWCNQWR